MPDITMCEKATGKLCSKCYRNDLNTKPCDYQSYFVKHPIKDEECECFIPTK